MTVGTSDIQRLDVIPVRGVAWRQQLSKDDEIIELLPSLDLIPRRSA